MSEVLKYLTLLETRDPSLHTRLQTSISLIASALHVYGGKNELFFSFNGGKDSTCVLHLLRAALVLRSGCSGGDVSENEVGKCGGYGDGVLLGGVRVVYFSSSAARDFPEVTEFMAECERLYRFRIERLGDFREGLAELVADGARGVLMGTRGGDPDAPLLCGPFAPTTGGWPPIMRVNPILSLSYVELWSFFRGCKISACSLYEKGYTSLGDVDTSVRNPALRVGGESSSVASAGMMCAAVHHSSAVNCVIDSTSSSAAAACLCAIARDIDSNIEYLPAWELTDVNLERAGRIKRKK